MNSISKILISILIFITCDATAQDSIFYIGSTAEKINGTYMEYVEITEANNTLETIENIPFIRNEKPMLNLGISPSSFWVKLRLFNHTRDSLVRLNIPAPTLDSISIYYPVGDEYKESLSGEKVHAEVKQVNDPYHSFLIPVKGEVTTIYFKVRGKEQLIFPLEVIAPHNEFARRNVFYGLFTGVILALFLYNLILAFFIREQVYYMYLIFLFSIYFAQANLMGMSHYFFGSWPYFNHISVYLFSALVGLSALRFMENFLVLRVTLPKSQIFVRIGYVLYGALFVAAVFGLESPAYMITQLSGLYAATVAMTIGTILSLRRNILAQFYLLAWTIFIVGIVIFSLKDYSIIPYNNFTKLTMPFGVIIEVILLSIALAHRINTLKKDNEKAQERIIEEMSRNENLIKNQNVLLEDKVKQRTEELEHTLSNLKQAQVKLIESEKMASLGLLTAGIAHEINNPINYVTANVIPLRANIEYLTELINAYKSLTPENFEEKTKEIIKLEEEIELDYTLNETSELIDGIEDGAKRTYNIVDGLRTFSRSDKTSKQISDLNKGIKSTLSVLKSQLKNITVELDLDPQLPKLNSQLGKLNQVFLNIINNALHAIEDRHGDNLKNGVMKIRSYTKNDRIFIEVEDNGAGIPKELVSKIFEPFYTSKPIGEGTGLGLSISYSIVEDHNGHLSVDSTVNQGTTFTIELPLNAES